MRYYMIIITAFILAIPSYTMQAQVHLGISFNLGIQPAWGPTGYDYVENYYMPAAEIYYNVPNRMYYFFQGGIWIGRSRLPARYGAFDHYGAYKVVVNERRPWRRHKMFKDKYASYGNRHDQSPIRDSRDSKYFVNKYHPRHKDWARERGQKQQKRQIQTHSYRSDNRDGRSSDNGRQNNNGGKQNGNRGGKNKR